MRWVRRVRNTTTGITTLLLLALIVLCAVATLLCGGSTALVVGLGGVVALDGAAYWCSDRVIRAVTRARPLRSGDAPWLRALVIELAGQARTPVPRIAVIDTSSSDALYTGRDPDHATILVTTGLACLDTRTLRGVLAHELAHIRGRDTLLGTVAMTLAVASAVVVVVEQVTALVGRPDADTLAQLLVAPLAALLLQRAFSRTREYAADRGSVQVNGDALALTDALGLMARAGVVAHGGRKAERAQHLLFKQARLLFNTHPPLAARIGRLRAVHEEVHPRRRDEAGAAPARALDPIRHVAQGEHGRDAEGEPDERGRGRVLEEFGQQFDGRGGEDDAGGDVPHRAGGL